MTKYTSKAGSKEPSEEQNEVKLPLKKFTDVRRKQTAAIKKPKDVDTRRDIDILFEDMSIEDLSSVMEKGGITKIIELQKK